MDRLGNTHIDATNPCCHQHLPFSFTWLFQPRRLSHGSPGTARITPPQSTLTEGKQLMTDWPCTCQAAEVIVLTIDPGIILRP